MRCFLQYGQGCISRIRVIHLWPPHGKKTGKKSGQHTICSETPFSKNSYYIETSQLIWVANQLTGFYMMRVFTARCFRTDYSFAIDESFFFRRDLILRVTKVFFRLNLIWQIISFIWRISGKTSKSANISSRKYISPKLEPRTVIKNVIIALSIHWTW